MAMYRAAELDAFPWQGQVIDRDLSSPPGSPAKGDRYIVKATGTGGWAGHDNAITYYNGSTWVFIAPVEGLVCWVKDEDLFVKHNGTAWDVLVPAASGMGYALSLIAGNLTPMSDNTTYFFGSMAGVAPQTTALRCIVYIPKAGTIKCVYVLIFSGTTGTPEEVPIYIRVNNSADTLIGNADLSSAVYTVSRTDLSISVSQNHYFEIKIVCPNFSTNPNNVRFGGVVYIE